MAHSDPSRQRCKLRQLLRCFLRCPERFKLKKTVWEIIQKWQTTIIWCMTKLKTWISKPWSPSSQTSALSTPQTTPWTWRSMWSTHIFRTTTFFERGLLRVRGEQTCSSSHLFRTQPSPSKARPRPLTMNTMTPRGWRPQASRTCQRKPNRLRWITGLWNSLRPRPFMETSLDKSRSQDSLSFQVSLAKK